MKELTLPTFKEVHKALSTTNLKLHASQVHGLICGILCGNPNSDAAWEELVTGGKETAKTHAVLQDLYQQSKKQLDEFLFEFELILPAEKEDLSARAEGLTLWCQGFLTGLKLAKIEIVGRPPSEITEAINDIIEIAKMNYEEVVESEEDENAYVELVEFVRMAVVLIFEELRDGEKSKASQSSSNRLH